MPLWDYRFLSLSADETERRRHALTQQGQYAQLSAVGIIFCLSVARLVTLQNTTNRTWWDKPLFKGFGETRKQYLLVSLWLIWLMGISVWGTGQDYLHLTKAVGHVALSQLPFQILLSPVSFLLNANPSTPSLLSVLTSLTPPTLAPYHRLLGRFLMVPLLLLHGTLYLNFFIRSYHPIFGVLLYKRIRDTDVQIGIVGSSIAICVLVFNRTFWWGFRHSKLFSLDTPWGRRRIFNIVHLTLVVVLMSLAYCHVIYARVFVLQSVVLLIINLACVKWSMQRSEVQ